MDDDHEGQQQGGEAQEGGEAPPYDPDPRLIGYLERAPRRLDEPKTREAKPKYHEVCCRFQEVWGPKGEVGLG